MNDGEASAAGLAACAERSTEEGASAAVETNKRPGPSPTPPAAVSGLTSDAKAVGADAIGGEIRSSRQHQGPPAVGE